jgi:CheY-like chemotaxis protein/PAS domain-containing protein
MSDFAHSESMIQPALLEIISEAISGALLIYDRNDSIVFASSQMRNFLHALPVAPVPGTRLRDFFGFLYDHGGYFPDDPDRNNRPPVSREDWIAGEIAALWKERSETVERRTADRWISMSRRRMPSGHGICVIRDVSEHKKREDQWRADLERVQITEDILDNLPFPLLVKDRNLICVAVNNAMCGLHRREPEEILSRRMTDVRRQSGFDQSEEADRQVLESGIPLTLTEQMTREDGVRQVFVTRRYRIGKPGRYFIVTAMQDISELTVSGEYPEWIASALDQPDTAPPDARPTGPASTMPDLFGRGILILTEDYDAERESLALLKKMGADASSVRSQDEFETFLTLARDVALPIDLIVIDSSMDIRCLELADVFGIPYVVLESFQMAEELVPTVMRHFRSARSAGIDAVDDWTIAPQPTLDVLVAEDNPVNQIVFSQILDGFGYRYAIASNGQEAVDLWQQRRPRIVLMDVTLPVLNGFEAATKIRSMESEPGSTPIIGVLSPAVEGDRAACYAAGMNDVVMKPLSPDSLEDKFRLYLKPRPFAHKTG